MRSIRGTSLFTFCQKRCDSMIASIIGTYKLTCIFLPAILLIWELSSHCQLLENSLNELADLESIIIIIIISTQLKLFLNSCKIIIILCGKSVQLSCRLFSMKTLIEYLPVWEASYTRFFLCPAKAKGTRSSTGI